MFHRFLGVLALALLLTACGGPVQEPLSLTFQPPLEAMPAAGSAVVLQVVTQGGAAPPGFQWFRDGNPIPGAKGPQLVLTPVSYGDAGLYQARVTDGVATLTTDPFILEPVDARWVVRTSADQGPDSLRAVLAAAGAFPGLHGIAFALPPDDPGVITLTADLPPLPGHFCLLGPLDKPLVLDGAGLYRPLFLDEGRTLILDNFTIANGLGRGGNAPGGGGGAAGMGGALFINNGAVTLRRMIFRDNVALGGSSAMGGDGENGGGAGFGTDSPATGGKGADGGFLRGLGGDGHLDGTGQGGEDATGGFDGAGGGAARGGLPTTPLLDWADNMTGGNGSFGGGGGFSVGPLGGGGAGSRFGGGGGGAGGSVLATFLPGSAGGDAGVFGGLGGTGDGILPGQGGGGAGLGGAVFFRKGTLAMQDCLFLGNRAQGGTGAEAGQGKGGAVFVYPFNYGQPVPTFDLEILKAQRFSGNSAADPGPAEDALFDNNDFYVAQDILVSARKVGTGEQRARRALERRYRWPVYPK